MSKEYVLYLDESSVDDIFAMGGFIIEKSQLALVDKEINDIKNVLWSSSDITTYNPIIHTCELELVKKYRSNKKFLKKRAKEAYLVLGNEDSSSIKNKYDSVYNHLSSFIRKANIVVISSLIDYTKLKEYLNVTDVKDIIGSKYNICLQDIIERFTKFLVENGATGEIVYESRNSKGSNYDSPDFKLKKNFSFSKSNGKGISIISNNIVFDKIKEISFISKSDNNSGLQLTDVLLYNIVKMHKMSIADYTDFMKKIYEKCYNANYNYIDKDLRDYWGIRVIPFDYLAISRNRQQIKKLSKRLDNLKNERNSLNKMVEKLKKELSELKCSSKDEQ